MTEKEPDIVVDEKCGNKISDRIETLSEALIERMKIVFRATHGGEMTPEDRNFLGIPPCSGECCP